MEQPFLRAYARLLVRTCHRRGCPAMGGHERLRAPEGGCGGHRPGLAQVRADKPREVEDGCDGTWVAHPALVPVRPGARSTAHARPEPDAPDPRPGGRGAELLAVPRRAAHRRGARARTCGWRIRYLESWLRGQGCVALYGLMEDAATAEMARMQLWQWLNHGVELDGLGRLDRRLFHGHVQDTLDRIQAEVGNEAFADGPLPGGRRPAGDPDPAARPARPSSPPPPTTCSRTPSLPR